LSRTGFVNKGQELTRKFDFVLFADYFQFYLQDESAEGDLSESWTQDAVDRLLALTSGTIGVGTVRNTNVLVTVDIADIAPEEHDFSVWDQVNECSIDVPSGRLVIAGCTDYFPEAARIELPSGTYRARIYYENLNSLTNNGLDGEDHYRIVLWSESTAPVRVLKQRRTRPEG
jgi:hypothetical protein